MGTIAGMAVLAVVVIVAGRVLAGQGARSWDVLRPGTRPSRRQAAGWGRSAARSAASYGRARWARSRPAGWMPARVRGTVIRDPEPGDGEGGPGRDDPQPGPSPRSSPPAVQGTAGTAGGPAAQAPATGAPQPPTGRTTPVTTPAVTTGAPALVPGAEEMTAGMTRLRAYAVAGNINAKRAALAALAEVFAQDAAAVAALARSMQEESMFGSEITEPIAQMGPALRALSTRAAEAESQVASLAGTPVGEVPASRHQAPDRHEMSETTGR